MADQNAPGSTDVQLVDDISGDAILSSLAALAQNGVMTMGITLNVSGNLISGLLIGRDEWFDLLAENGANHSAGAGELLGAIRDKMREVLTVDDEDPGSATYGFLHLRDARVMAGNGMTSPGMMWRVRIPEVSGWALETMS